MGRSKLKRKKWTKNLEDEPVDSGVPIPNLPAKFLLMHVKSGTKIRNVLGHALKEFPNYGSVVWTAAGQGVGKAISCAELFKKKHEGLHQITRLRYVRSKKSEAENKNGANTDTRHVPEIHILLAKEIKDTSESGYQAPDDRGEFVNDEEMKNTRKGRGHEAGGNVTCIDAEEFAAMGLRIGQKRPKKEQQAEAPPRKNKKRRNNDR
ncbi:ribonuclease P protein subunit p25-like protein [Colletes gigas]|uniref:ribonuclease P protein subunit p25-like protein n=1 Tax=Colletes gigas TaxID=935657 RepID=UPI001C9AE3A6|nr:ribonuclease P protein subunit p25-like protein [Colletes gigas]XP_043258504.1 ribonuclease P protein subunit p25-like protein [Colletes gigas]XP_043258505.1 ribonuclease P protein subunit p25-like protein [Colletes gigas]